MRARKRQGRALGRFLEKPVDSALRSELILGTDSNQANRKLMEERNHAGHRTDVKGMWGER